MIFFFYFNIKTVEKRNSATTPDLKHVIIIFSILSRGQKIVNHSIILKGEARLYRASPERESERRDRVSSYCFKARKFAPLDASRLHASEGVRFSTRYILSVIRLYIFGCAWDFSFASLRIVAEIDTDTSLEFSLHFNRE